MSDELARLRIHEAAHSVLGYRLLGRAGDVFILQGDSAQTSIRHYASDRLYAGIAAGDADAIQEAEDGIVVVLAGEAAEHVFGWRASAEYAVPLEDDFQGPAFSDSAKAFRMVEPISAPMYRADACRRLMGRAIALCREERSRIQNVADALATNYDRMVGSEVEVLLESH
jgi:hypothetical protein